MVEISRGTFWLVNKHMNMNKITNDIKSMMFSVIFTLKKQVYFLERKSSPSFHTTGDCTGKEGNAFILEEFSSFILTRKEIKKSLAFVSENERVLL